MTFTSGIPLDGQSLGSSKVPVRNNFTAIVNDLAVNHVAINLADQGKHKFMQMPEQGSAPSTAANEGALYTKQDPFPGTGTAEACLFYRGESSNYEYMLAKPISASTARFGTTKGWTFLPGGLIYQWGQLLNPGTSGSISFATDNINFPNQCYQVMLTLQHNSAANESATVQPTPTTTGFSYRTTSSSANTRLFWMAIGF